MPDVYSVAVTARKELLPGNFPASVVVHVTVTRHGRFERRKGDNRPRGGVGRHH